MWQSLSLCWITDGHTIHPSIEGVLPPIGNEPSPFGNSASKAAILQVYVATPGYGMSIHLVLNMQMGLALSMATKSDINLLIKRQSCHHIETSQLI